HRAVVIDAGLQLPTCAEVPVPSVRQRPGAVEPVLPGQVEDHLARREVPRTCLDPERQARATAFQRYAEADRGVSPGGDDHAPVASELLSQLTASAWAARRELRVGPRRRLETLDEGLGDAVHFS